MAIVKKKTQINQIGKKTPKALDHNYELNNKKSRYSTYCKQCIHSCSLLKHELYCQWFGESCIDAVWNKCPIPTFLTACNREHGTYLVEISKAKNRTEKGGTVVPPSKFHFVSTEETETQSVMEKTLRPHGSAHAHAGEKPQAPTQISHQKCEETDCPFYGMHYDYCRVCSYNEKSLLRQKPVMCERLITGSCDGHACCCDNFEPFNPDGE